MNTLSAPKTSQPLLFNVKRQINLCEDFSSSTVGKSFADNIPTPASPNSSLTIIPIRAGNSPSADARIIASGSSHLLSWTDAFSTSGVFSVMSLEIQNIPGPLRKPLSITIAFGSITGSYPLDVTAVWVSGQDRVIVPSNASTVTLTIPAGALPSGQNGFMIYIDTDGTPILTRTIQIRSVCWREI
ncbi:hypothetical protein [Pseudomonas plecoglossicida]|uniref:hypothetical protein n=1 Tax=Pseudomonas plecoglossicida TaxID=70775 RepID=UPI003D1A53EE